MLRLSKLVFAGFIFLLSGCGQTPSGTIHSDLTEFVNPLMGTDSEFALTNGNTYPAIALPWGMNFWTAMTANYGDGWTYKYRDLDILHSVNEMDSNSFYKATGSTSSRIPAGSCCRPLMRFARQASPACPAVVFQYFSRQFLVFNDIYYKISLFILKNFMPLYPALKRAGFTGSWIKSTDSSKPTNPGNEEVNNTQMLNCGRTI